MSTTQLYRTTGVAFARVLLGVIFFWQGYGKVFDIGVDSMYQGYFLGQLQLGETFLPEWLIQLTAYFTSYAELIGGALLTLGLFRYVTYCTLALVLLIVSFGHGAVEPIWDLQHVIFRAALLLPLFLIPQAWDRWNLDNVIATIRKRS